MRSRLEYCECGKGQSNDTAEAETKISYAIVICIASAGGDELLLEIVDEVAHCCLLGFALRCS